MLEAPRMLLDRALLPLNPLEPPLNPLDREELPEEKSRPPILLLLALGLRLPLPRSMELAPAELARELPADRLLAPALAPRLLAPRDCWDALARLPADDEPREEPENLSDVDLLE
jgi:hypothetical protein